MKGIIEIISAAQKRENQGNSDGKHLGTEMYEVISVLDCVRASKKLRFHW